MTQTLLETKQGERYHSQVLAPEGLARDSLIFAPEGMSIDETGLIRCSAGLIPFVVNIRAC